MLIPFCYIAACLRPMDIVFAVDNSISSEDFVSLLRLINAVIDGFLIDYTQGSRIGLVTFDDRAENVFFMNAHQGSKQQILDAVLMTQTSNRGRINMAAAIRLAREEQFTALRGDRQNVPNVLVVITTANSDVEQQSTLVETHRARDEGIMIVPIGVGPRAPTTILREMSVAPQRLNSDYYIIPSFSHIWRHADSIVSYICHAKCKYHRIGYSKSIFQPV